MYFAVVLKVGTRRNFECLNGTLDFVGISKINLMNACSQSSLESRAKRSLVSFDFNISWSCERPGLHCAPGPTQTKLGENLLKLAQID